MIELKANLEHGRELCELTHSREQLKLKKLMYIYETVVEVHYLKMNHSGRRPLTYNVAFLLFFPHAQLKDLFVYEGRTSSILSTTSSVNAYSTFNPMISHSFGENYFGGIGMMDEPDELASLSTASQPRLTPDELQYLQLLAASQQDTYEEPSYETPALIVNRAGSTETSGTNWLLPVAAKDNYEHFFTSTLNTHSFLAFSASQPLQTRL